MDWISVDKRLPPPDRPVAVAFMGSPQWPFWTRAVWIPAKYKVSGDDGDDFLEYSEYDEEKDEYYWPEGWYEDPISDPDTCPSMLLEVPPTHWSFVELPGGGG